MIRAVAIDDEPFALEVVRLHAGKVPFLDLTACFTDPLEAIAQLASDPVDLVFLDIKMPDITGLELMHSVLPKPMVVFTTAYPEHAAKSYELDAIDYLLKPFSFQRFLKACHKANDALKRSAYQENHRENNLFIKSGYETIKIHVDEILFLQGAGNYVTFVMSDRRSIMSRLTMNETAAMLPANLFARVHRSFIINKSKVDRLERHRIYIGEQSIPISNAFAVNLY